MDTENITSPVRQEVQPVNYSPATVQTVKDTIFKGANDAELQLYFHKCLSVGCHPLDGLIHPSKFADGGWNESRFYHFNRFVPGKGRRYRHV